MSSEESLDILTKAIRALTFAVWALVVVSILNLVVYFSPVYTFLASEAPPDQESLASEEFAAPMGSATPFHELSLEEAVARSSVIFYAEHQDHGERVECVIKEILKQSAASTVQHQPGDIYNPCSKTKQPNAWHGEGAVVFLDDPSGRYRRSASVFDGRIPAFEHMSLTELRAAIAREKS